MIQLKTLYITDLDGTLLSSDAVITEKTKEIINSLVAKGMYFTAATARSIYSVKPLVSGLDINVPCLLMNGVSIYDLRQEKYICSEAVPKEAQKKIIDIIHDLGVSCFMYKIHDGVLAAYYEKVTSHVMRSFAEERKHKYKKPFIQCRDMLDEIDDGTIYFTMTDELEVIRPVKEAVSAVEGSDIAFYEDTYTHKWYLEIFSAKASKANGIKRLRREYGFDKVVCFGDNLNDLSMFEESDIKIAVENARSEVREAADFITLSNDENGVAEYLLEHYK